MRSSAYCRCSLKVLYRFFSFAVSLNSISFEGVFLNKWINTVCAVVTRIQIITRTALDIRKSGAGAAEMSF